jgi:hypothetical protein
MSEPTFLLHLGDPRVTMPLGAALLAWMLAARAWRMALWWGLLLAGGLSLVGISKIVFLGWGGGVPLLGYKALSGHAAGASAVFPMLFWMLAHGRADDWQGRALRLGLGLGVLNAVLLVFEDQHSVAEALAGYAVGAAVSLGSIRLGSAGMPALRLKGLLPAMVALLAAAWMMKWAHLGYWMIRAARLLTGNTHVYPL